MGLIRYGVSKWLPALPEEEGVEGMAAGGGGEFGVGADQEGGASV